MSYTEIALLAGEVADYQQKDHLIKGSDERAKQLCIIVDKLN